MKDNEDIYRDRFRFSFCVLITCRDAENGGMWWEYCFNMTMLLAIMRSLTGYHGDVTYMTNYQGVDEKSNYS